MKGKREFQTHRGCTPHTLTSLTSQQPLGRGERKVRPGVFTQLPQRQSQSQGLGIEAYLEGDPEGREEI